MRLLVKLFIIISVLTSSCRFPKFKNPNELPVDIPAYAVVFNEIDNFATLEINGLEIFTNENLLRATDDPIVVDIKEHLKRGQNKLVITLTDTPGGQCLNNEWSINFDIYTQGELFDYWQQKNEKGSDCEDGVKVVKEFTLGITSL